MKTTTLTLSLAILTLPLAGCGDETAPSAPVIRPVRYQEVTVSGGPRERKLSGTARAGLESQLSFRVGGSVQAVPVSVGQKVRRGDLIARLDPIDYEIQTQEAEAALAQALAAQRKAEADYERVRGLYENRNAAKSELDAARAQAESTRAQVEAAEQRVARARRQLAYTRLTAPVDGAIAAVRVEENENVQPGQAVALLTSGTRPEVEVAMPEVLISRVTAGDRVDVTCDALPGVVLPAVVTEVGVAAVGASAAFPVVVRLEPSDQEVRSGMAATVTFRFAPEGGRRKILLPPVAVGEDREGRFVFVLERGEGDLATAVRRGVEVGEITPEGIEVLGGLAGGELVATAGVRRIEDGQQVRLLPKYEASPKAAESAS